MNKELLNKSELKKEHESCLVCSGTKLQPLKGYEHAHLCQCKNCGFVFSKRIPTEEELVKHYEGYGRDDYLSPITIKRYEELLDSFEPFRKNNRILDVGCGIGYFLEVAKRKGWEVYGTEFTDEAVKICKEKGISLQQGVLDPSNYGEGFFDVITSIEVIEHINNPITETKNIHKLLRKGGLFYFTTPNFNALSRLYLKEKYNVICYPEHLCYYTPSTIKKLMKKVGFKKKKVQTTGVSITRIKTSQGNSSQKYISESSDDEQIRQKIESNRLLGLAKRLVNASLTFFGVGNSLKGHFIKK